jgi:hypothetical protein
MILVPVNSTIRNWMTHLLTRQVRLERAQCAFKWRALPHSCLSKHSDSLELMEFLEFSAKGTRLLFRQGAPLPTILALFVFSSLERTEFGHREQIGSYLAQFAHSRGYDN